MVEEPCCLKFTETGVHDFNCPMVQELTFGLTIRKNGQTWKSWTGRTPSPSKEDPASVVTGLVEFLNGVLGTSFAVVEAVDENNLVEVAPGEYQPLAVWTSPLLELLPLEDEEG